VQDQDLEIGGMLDVYESARTQRPLKKYSPFRPQCPLSDVLVILS
jgi:hypothetical protein